MAKKNCNVDKITEVEQHQNYHMRFKKRTQLPRDVIPGKKDDLINFYWLFKVVFTASACFISLLQTSFKKMEF